jgi:hypothetical protein
MGTALIFNHFYAQKSGLDESSPYNKPYNMNKIGLMNQAPRGIEKLRGMGPVPIFMSPFLLSRICLAFFSEG